MLLRLLTSIEMKTYELFQGEELNIAEKIQQRRLQMLIHSCIYYEFNRNVISDRQFDIWAKELVQLQKDYPEIAKQVDWAEAFEGFDGMEESDAYPGLWRKTCHHGRSGSMD